MGKYETRDQQYIRLFSPSKDNLWVYHSTLRKESNLTGFRNVIDNYFNNLQLGSQTISLDSQQMRIVKMLRRMAKNEFDKEISFLKNFVPQKTIDEWTKLPLDNQKLGEIIDQLNNILTHSKIYEEHKKVFQDTAKKIKTYGDKSNKMIYQNISATIGSMYYECFLNTWKEMLTPGTNMYYDLIDIMNKARKDENDPKSPINVQEVIDKIISYISIKTTQEFFFDNKSYYKGFLKEIYPDLEEIDKNLLNLDKAITILENFEHPEFKTLMNQYFKLQAVSPFMEGFKKEIVTNFQDFAKVSKKIIKNDYTFKSTKKPGAIEGQKGSLGGNLFEVLNVLFENAHFSKMEEKKLKSFLIESTEFSNDTFTIYAPTGVDFEKAAEKSQNFVNTTAGIKGKAEAAEKFVDFFNDLPKGTFLIVQSAKYPFIEKLTTKLDIKGTARSGVEVDKILDDIFQDSSGRKRQQYFHLLAHYIYNQLYFSSNNEALESIANATYNIIPYLGRLIFDEFEILGREEQNTSSSNMLFLFTLGGIKIPVSHLLMLLAQAFEEKSPIASSAVSHIKGEGGKPGYSQFRLLQKNLELHISLYLNPVITPPLSVTDESTLVTRWEGQKENFVYDRKIETNFFHYFHQYLRDVLKNIK